MTCVIQPEQMQVATTMLSGDVNHDTSTSTFCSIIFKSIVSFFLRRSATVESSSASTSESSIVLADVHTKLIPTHTNCTQIHLHIPQHQHQHQYSHNQQQHHQHPNCTIHSQSTLSLYFTTQPSSTFSFYSCSSCSSPFMPSASFASSAIAPLPFIVSPTTTFNSSAGHFRPFCVNVSDDSRFYGRLLVQLEETERRFDDFWNTHLIRLKQCLDLRRFEQVFKELQVG